MYTIYKVLPEDDRNLQMFMNQVVLKARFPEVIGISVKSSRSRALVFDFLMVNFFIHTILLRTEAMRENADIVLRYESQSDRCDRTLCRCYFYSTTILQNKIRSISAKIYYAQHNRPNIGDSIARYRGPQWPLISIENFTLTDVRRFSIANEVRAIIFNYLDKNY